jgi:hypothetical protein
MGILSALGFTENKTEKKARTQMDAAAQAEQGRTSMLDTQAAQSRGRYQGALDSYDPQAYMQQAAQANASQLGEMYNQGEGQRRVAAQRSGFINSGAGIGALNRDFSSRLAQTLGTLSLQTAGLQQNKLGMQGDLYGNDVNQAEGARNNSLDLLAGSRDAAVAARNARLRGTTGVLKAGVQAAGMFL